MIMIEETLVERVARDYDDKNKVRRALIRALCTIPDQNNATEELVLRLAKNYLRDIPKKAVSVPVEVEVVQPLKGVIKGSKRGRKPLKRGKSVLGGTKNTYRCWWQEHGEQALEMARDDKVFPEGILGGNYALVKDFLKNEWKNKFDFTLPELKQAMEEKFPDRARHSGFRLQRWGNASYWEETDGVAVKPLWKQLERKNYMNIYWIGDEE